MGEACAKFAKGGKWDDQCLKWENQEEWSDRCLSCAEESRYHNRCGGGYSNRPAAECEWNEDKDGHGACKNCGLPMGCDSYQEGVAKGNNDFSICANCYVVKRAHKASSLPNCTIS